ncbi:MAG: hypothetical protein M1457_00825, partial [bacterium]|nr:hypothetical protein [bacterium]
MVLIPVMAAIVAGALFMRLPGLRHRPMHVDEAVQAVKTGLLFDSGHYRYNPHEFHGPSLYYLTLPTLWAKRIQRFAQADEATFRRVTVVFGVGLIVLLLLVADGLGLTETLAAAILMAISPAMVFYSRYYIQEMLLVFFSFAAI